MVEAVVDTLKNYIIKRALSTKITMHITYTGLMDDIRIYDWVLTSCQSKCL